jgi:hypothetical protein
MTYISQNTKHNRMSKKKIVEKIANKAIEIAGIVKLTEEVPVVKQMQSLGDATFCSACNANTKYKSECSVCGIPSEENRLRYMGELNFLKQKYPHYCSHIK